MPGTPIRGRAGAIRTCENSFFHEVISLSPARSAPLLRRHLAPHGSVALNVLYFRYCIEVMDNLSAHKRERVKELIEGRDCELLYLLSYSPDFNPIEEAFSKIKRFLRKAESRMREALVEAIGVAISAVTAKDARGFFEHCGHRLA